MKLVHIFIVFLDDRITHNIPLLSFVILQLFDNNSVQHVWTTCARRSGAMQHSFQVRRKRCHSPHHLMINLFFWLTRQLDDDFNLLQRTIRFALSIPLSVSPSAFLLACSPIPCLQRASELYFSTACSQYKGFNVLLNCKPWSSSNILS